MKKSEYKAGVKFNDDGFWVDVDTFYAELIEEYKSDLKSDLKSDQDWRWVFPILLLGFVGSIYFKAYSSAIFFAVFPLLGLSANLLANKISCNCARKVIKDVRDDGNCFRIVRNGAGLYGIYKWSGVIFKSILPPIYDMILKVLLSDSYICAKDGKYGVYCVKKRKFVIPLMYDNISVGDTYDVLEAWSGERKISFDIYGKVLNMPNPVNKSEIDKTEELRLTNQCIGSGYWSIDSFFPVAGVALGKSTLLDLKRHKYIEEIEYYEDGTVCATYVTDDCFSFFYIDAGCKAVTSMSVAKNLPPEWYRLGFSWELSYNEWVRLFREKGFTVEYLKDAGLLSAAAKDDSIKFQLFFDKSGYRKKLSTIWVYAPEYPEYDVI